MVSSFLLSPPLPDSMSSRASVLKGPRRPEEEEVGRSAACAPFLPASAWSFNRFFHP